MYLLLILLFVFAYYYAKKKNDAKKWEMYTYHPENTTPYKKSFGTGVCEYEYQMFDQFVKTKWNRNFLSWESLNQGGILANFCAPHHIMVRHTDGTYHDEYIIVKRAAMPDKENAYGSIYEFEVRGEVQPIKPDDEPIKPQPDPKPKKPDNEPKKPEETPIDFAKKWLEEKKAWIEKTIESGYFTIKFGNGENECPKEYAESVFEAINDLNLYQLQMDSEGIHIYPATDI